MVWSDLTDGVMRIATQTFGEAITYTPSGGQAITIQGVFRDQFYELDTQSGYPVLTEQPNLGIRNADFATPPKQGDTLVKGGVTYTVHAVQRDGEAGSILLLYEGVDS